MRSGLDWVLSQYPELQLNYTKKIKNDIIEYVITKKNNLDIEKSKSDNNIKRLDSLQRSARNIKNIIDNNLEFNDLILTLTFKENMQDYNISDKEFKKFIRKLKNKYGDFEYISVKELQKRGAIHYHVILFTYGKIINMSEQELIITWGLGRCELDYTRAENYDSLRFYFSKYLTDWEKGESILTNRKIYTTSRGVKKITIEKTNQNDVLNVIDNNKNHIIIKKGNENWFYVKIIVNNAWQNKIIML